MNLENSLAYDNFINDLEEDVMPFVEKTFSVSTGTENTAIAGFSMGGSETSIYMCMNVYNYLAEVTGKQHAHVMRDIRNLLSQGVAESNFGLGSYTDANGQERPLFNLTPKGCLILASGYDAVLREKIIDRLE